LPVLARAGDPISFKKKSGKETCPTRAYSLIFSQPIEHPRDARPCADRAKIGILADFDADVSQKRGAR
jgi:hypothetical protein